MVECDTLSSSLKELNINTLDYLKIDTQGAELEILKGLENYRPLLIKCEVQIFPMYKKEPSWTEVADLLYKLGYIVSDWKTIGSHATRTPVEMDMIFIPNFNDKIAVWSDKQKSFLIDFFKFCPVYSSNLSNIIAFLVIVPVCQCSSNLPVDKTNGNSLLNSSFGIINLVGVIFANLFLFIYLSKQF